LISHSIENIIIHHGQDGVHLGNDWLYQVGARDKIRVSCSKEEVKGNIHSELLVGRFREENLSLFWDQEDFERPKEIISERLRYYNLVPRYSALRNKLSIKYLKEKRKIFG